MPVLVHLTPEKFVKRILRRGITARRLRNPEIGRGVFCMPLLPNYYVSHQWLRELKRGGQKTILGIDFKLPAKEKVWIGHFNQPHVRMPLGAAMRILMDQEDPRGYELIVPRSIELSEIVRARAVSRVVGWRYFPAAHGRPPCPYPCCQYGGIKTKRVRAREKELDAKRRVPAD